MKKNIRILFTILFIIIMGFNTFSFNIDEKKLEEVIFNLVKIDDEYVKKNKPIIEELSKLTDIEKFEETGMTVIAKGILENKKAKDINENVRTEYEKIIKGSLEKMIKEVETASEYEKKEVEKAFNEFYETGVFKFDGKEFFNLNDGRKEFETFFADRLEKEKNKPMSERYKEIEKRHYTYDELIKMKKNGLVFLGPVVDNPEYREVLKDVDFLVGPYEENEPNKITVSVYNREDEKLIQHLFFNQISVVNDKNFKEKTVKEALTSSDIYLECSGCMKYSDFLQIKDKLELPIKNKLNENFEPDDFIEIDLATENLCYEIKKASDYFIEKKDRYFIDINKKIKDINIPVRIVQIYTKVKKPFIPYKNLKNITTKEILGKEVKKGNYIVVNEGSGDAIRKVTKTEKKTFSNGKKYITFQYENEKENNVSTGETDKVTVVEFVK